MFTMNSIMLILIFSGLLVFTLNYKHLLLMLLSLEFMVIGFYTYMLMLLNFTSNYICLIYLVFTTCEGALGLLLLVSMTKVYGSDYFLLMNLN